MARPDPKKTNLQGLFRRRADLDRRFASYKQQCGVLFADISGSNSFYER